MNSKIQKIYFDEKLFLRLTGDKITQDHSRASFHFLQSIVYYNFYLKSNKKNNQNWIWNSTSSIDFFCNPLILSLIWVHWVSSLIHRFPAAYEVNRAKADNLYLVNRVYETNISSHLPHAPMFFLSLEYVFYHNRLFIYIPGILRKAIFRRVFRMPLVRTYFVIVHFFFSTAPEPEFIIPPIHIMYFDFCPGPPGIFISFHELIHELIHTDQIETHLATFKKNIPRGRVCAHAPMRSCTHPSMHVCVFAYWCVLFLFACTGR